MQTSSLTPVTKDEFYNKLAAETKDVILDGQPAGHGLGNFYPYTSEFKYRYSSSLFGKAISLGYVNGEFITEYYLNKSN